MCQAFRSSRIVTKTFGNGSITMAAKLCSGRTPFLAEPKLRPLRTGEPLLQPRGGAPLLPNKGARSLIRPSRLPLSISYPQSRSSFWDRSVLCLLRHINKPTTRAVAPDGSLGVERWVHSVTRTHPCFNAGWHTQNVFLQ